MAAITPRQLGLLTIVAAVLGTFFMLWRFSVVPELPLTLSTETVASDSVLQWRTGNSQRYSVDVESSFRMTMPGGSGQTMKLGIEGVLEQSTLAIGPAGVMSGMRFTSFKLSIDGASDPGVNQALQSPFRTLYNKNGQALEFEFPAIVLPEHRDILENLVNMFQVVMGEGEDWEAVESNASGRYKASYQRTSEAEISKQKLYYLAADSTGSAPEVKSTESILLDANNDWITEMTLNEVVITTQIGSVPTRVSNHATIKLLPAQTQVAVNAWNFPTASEPDQRATSVSALSVMTHAEAQKRLAVTLRELEQAEESLGSLINRVANLLLADEQLPEVLLEILRTEELSVRARADLYLAFELAGTPASQAVLSAIMVDGSWPPQDAMRAIVAAGGIAEPTGDTLATLWGLARSNLAGTERRDLPSTAALAIGSIGSSLRESEGANYSALRADLLTSASSAVGPKERAVYLYALGNTADPDPVLKRDIVSYLDDPSPEVRSVAAKTLGRLGTDQIETELMERVKQEPSGQARASMIGALTTWDKPPADAIAWTRGSIGQEPDEGARYNMAVLLGNNMDAFPENRRVLEAMLESERSKRIRQQVANMLY